LLPISFTQQQSLVEGEEEVLVQTLEVMEAVAVAVGFLLGLHLLQQP
jgi:hypothetical protein